MKILKSVTPKATILLLCTMLLFACKKDDDVVVSIPSVDHDRAELADMKLMGTYSMDDIRKLVSETGAELEFVLYNPVKAYSVKYYTVDHRGNEILVSGALCVPQDVGAMPIMSIQHGTVIQKDRVASIAIDNSTEGIIGLMTASMGYLSLIPDYPGLGASLRDHPYLHAPSIVPSVIDFIRVGMDYCAANEIILKNEVYLTGYSEGGYISLMAQKCIEEECMGEINLEAVAPMAGPYDLYGSFKSIFEKEYYGTPAYVAYFLKSYNDIYRWNRLDEFFNPEYSYMMDEIFDGSRSWSEVEYILPSTLRDLLHPDFIEDYYKNEGSIVMKALKENTMLSWAPRAPIHFIHGDCDDVVFCENASCACDLLLSNGARDVKLTMLSGKNHETAGPLAIAAALEWMDDFRPDQ